MDTKRLKFFIKTATISWLIIGLLLAAGVLLGFLSKQAFINVFLIGMVAYAVVTGLLNSALIERTKRGAKQEASEHEMNAKQPTGE